MTGGIVIRSGSATASAEAWAALSEQLVALALAGYVVARQGEDVRGAFVQCELRERFLCLWAPGWDTMGLCDYLELDTRASQDDLAREILLAMLASPVALEFPSYDELASSVRIRQFIVQAARQTAMNFETSAAERPVEDWTYAEDTGFILRPSRPLVEALERATQPPDAGSASSFSCYRATEYVILLALAREAQHANPQLLAQLQRQWERRAIMSGAFHEVFLREYGSLETPLPIKYYIPGDRIWFRNPDSRSADIAGYEGSWVVYLGNGEFPNFWCRERPFSLLSKCVEVYHWRDGAYLDEAGELQMDEDEVARRVAQTMSDPQLCEQVFERMFRLRDPRGVYAEGGCMDATRESTRWVRPGTMDIVLPMA